MKKRYRKVIMVGLDGATWDLIRPWADAGKLPTFQKLLKNGVYGNLKSVIPAMTPLAWASFATGVNPGKHNIFGWFVRERSEDKPVNSTHRRAKPIWSTLSENDMKSVVVNVPLTYPCDNIKGIVISGLMTPHETPQCCPENFKRELLKKFPDYRILAYPPLKADIQNKRLYLKKAFKMIKLRRDVTLYLMKNYSWELMVIVFYHTDSIQHSFWQYMDSKHPLYNPNSPMDFKQAIFRAYKIVDDSLRQILAAIDKQTVLIVISDHGAGPLYYGVYINNFLRDLGLLKLMWSSRLLYDLVFTHQFLVKLLRRIIKFAPKNIKKRIRRKASSFYPVPSITENLNLSKTKVYYTHRGLKIIKRNIEPERDYEDFRNWIIEQLYKLKDPKTGQRLVRKAHKREHIYWGPYVENASDLILEMEDGYVHSEGFGKKSIMLHAPDTCKHEQNGIFVAYGPCLSRGKEIEGAEITDIAPTILHMMGMPIPTYMDGKVLREIF